MTNNMAKKKMVIFTDALIWAIFQQQKNEKIKKNEKTFPSYMPFHYLEDVNFFW